MNHKRGKAKNQRSGCLMCKPHKANHSKVKERAKPSVQRHLQPEVFDRDLNESDESFDFSLDDQMFIDDLGIVLDD